MSPVLYFFAGSVADVDWTHVVSTERPSAVMRARMRAVHVSDDRVQSMARMFEVIAFASSRDIVHSRRGFVGSVSNRPAVVGGDESIDEDRRALLDHALAPGDECVRTSDLGDDDRSKPDLEVEGG
jgi:hypothetical protein